MTSKPSAPIELHDPYPDLERAYVAQVCLTWEALNWNYASFRRHNDNIAARCCPARVAQEFQQFQVLLHRFIENEPYEYGRRPEVYARMKNSIPKLLLVPEFIGSFLTSACLFVLLANNEDSMCRGGRREGRSDIGSTVPAHTGRFYPDVHELPPCR
jgi:hypothetical protein